MHPRPDADSPFIPPTGPNYEHEAALLAKGMANIAGVDEAGRGPLAGPVVAAAVILRPNRIPPGLDDSKKLSAERRALLFDLILRDAFVAWTSMPAAEIDRRNIRVATLAAMARAAEALPVRPDAVLIDGRDIPPDMRFRTRAIVKGDASSLSIAAASIVAKVARDRMMEQASADFPGYGFSAHVGYGTRLHGEALTRLGPCAIHRRSFAPVAALSEA